MQLICEHVWCQILAGRRAGTNTESSEPIQKAVKDLFAVTNKQCKVIVPYECQTAIVKGAVMFAFQPRRISSRIARASYGFDVSKEFDEKKHDAKYMATMAGKQWCSGLFSVVVRKGEILNFGTVKKNKLRTNNQSKYDGFTLLDMYCSPEKNVKYTAGCNKIASLKIEHDFEMYKHSEIGLKYIVATQNSSLKQKIVIEIYGVRQVCHITGLKCKYHILVCSSPAATKIFINYFSNIMYQ